MNTALLLIALGFGYKIYAEASTTPKKKTKKLGKIVGGVIMVISLIGAICTTSTAIYCGMSYGCSVGRFGKRPHFAHRFGSKFPCPLLQDVKNQTSPDQEPLLPPT